MFLIDNILLSPVHGLMAIFREVQKAAQKEIESEAETVRAQLCDLYLLLETKQISEDAFDDQERLLLDRLDVIEARHSAAVEQAKADQGDRGEEELDDDDDQDSDDEYDDDEDDEYDDDDDEYEDDEDEDEDEDEDDTEDEGDEEEVAGERERVKPRVDDSKFGRIPVLSDAVEDVAKT